MDDRIVLDELFPLQAELDADIHERHSESYESTRFKRLLALLVELGEFANETRCFKFWSLKGPADKDVILEEYADGMHFFLSLGIPLGVTTYSHRYNVYIKDPTEAIINVYKLVIELNENYDPEHYARAFGAYLNILPLYGFSSEDAIAAYKKKLGVNHVRQETKY